nr:hypothetical protein [Tanacetum cinerariifolium]
MHSNFLIFNRERKLGVPSITIAQLGVSNQDYLSNDVNMEPTTPKLNDLTLSLFKLFTGSSKIGSGPGRTKKVRINYYSKNLLIYSHFQEKINEVQMKALADFEDQFETYSGLLAPLPKDLKQLLYGLSAIQKRINVSTDVFSAIQNRNDQQKDRESFSQTQKRDNAISSSVGVVGFMLTSFDGDGEDDCLVLEVDVTGSGYFYVLVDVSIGNVEDKILVPKLPKNYARCGHPVDGPYCQGCALLRKKLEEDLVTYFQDFQNTSESSDDSTNVVNAPREPFVVKQDHGVNSSQNPPHIDEYEVIKSSVEDLVPIPSESEDEVIKSSVEDLVPIPSEFKGIPDTMCDVHLVNNPTPLEVKDHFEIVINSNDDYSSSDNDSLYYVNIEYVEAPPHDSELVSLEVEKIVTPEDEEVEDDNLREKLLKVNFLITEIEALKDNPTPSSEFLTKSSSTSPKSFLEETNTLHNSLPEFENFCFDLEDIS